jgi:NAD(P)-dependent dehydrogenase (short-subunit alcohol dehydrogenase family)
MAAAALITGAAKRIGRAIALELARKGLDIALHYRSSEADAEEAAREIEKLGAACERFQADLSRSEEVLSLIPAVMAKMPRCNVLVNSASVFERATLRETEPDLLERQFGVNFKAPLLLCREFAARVEDGLIINLLDTRITSTRPAYFAYSLSKKALAELTRLAARELAPRIRVNGICPGLILAPPGESDDYLDRFVDRVPLRRKGAPSDVASAVAFLLDSRFVTGQLLFVDGGEHLL